MSLVISDDIHFPPTAVTDPEQLKKGHFGYRSFIAENMLTSSGDAAGFPVETLANPLTAERWKATTADSEILIDAGAPVKADYIGMASHNFATQNATLTIEYSNDAASWNLITSHFSADNKPIMVIFNEIESQYWRISISADSPVFLGVLYIGQLLLMERGIYGGHTPITMGRNTRRIQNKTEGGQFAGISIIREGVSTSINFQHMDANWYRANFEPFVIAARGKPFFWAWRNQEFPAEVGYVWTTGDIRPSNMGIRNLMQVEFSVEGYSDE